MFQTALVIVTRPVSLVRHQLPVYLSEINRLVSKTVYVQIQTENGKPDQIYKYAHKVIPFNFEIRKFVKEFYASSSSTCSSLDIRVLLENISNTNKTLDSYKLKNVCDLVMIDRALTADAEKNLLSAVKSTFDINKEAEVKYLTLDGCETDTKKQKLEEAEDIPEVIDQVAHTVLGGTFDRLHTGHKLLLSEGCLLGTQSLTIGVTDGTMNAKKTLCELILPVQDRIGSLREFLQDVKPSLEYKLVPITDMFGPSIVDPDLQLIALSQETQRGGTKINEERKKKGLSMLQEYTIELIEDKCRSQYEEEKVSSSSQRKRLLGTLFHPVKESVNPKDRPYIIGLTGGIASGKSAICKRLEGLGAATVDCDKLGHKAYIKGTPGFDKVIAAFGADIVGEDGEVNRKALGAKVFANKEQMQKLNSIVWPEIAALAKSEIQQLAEAGSSVIVLEAAILLEAGWETMVHEVWLTIIPQDEAVRRMIERNKLSDDQARQRLVAQLSNEERVQRSNVIFSSLWEYEYTQSQVEKAWTLLQNRIGGIENNKQTSNL